MQQERQYITMENGIVTLLQFFFDKFFRNSKATIKFWNQFLENLQNVTDRPWEQKHNRRCYSLIDS